MDSISCVQPSLRQAGALLTEDEKVNDGLKKTTKEECTMKQQKHVLQYFK